MKITKSKQYLVKTDMELFLQLLDQLQGNGINELQQLKAWCGEAEVANFNEFMAYLSGPDCPPEAAIMIEEIIDRLRLAEADREAILTSSNEVGNYLADKLAGHKQEEFWAIYIDNGNHIIAEKKLFQGTLDRTVVHPREVFRWAMVYGCAGIFIAHNHPSGNLFPSPSDVKFTKELGKASKVMKIDFLDHFIVGKGDYLSMKEHELF